MPWTRAWQKGFRAHRALNLNSLQHTENPREAFSLGNSRWAEKCAHPGCADWGSDGGSSLWQLCGETSRGFPHLPVPLMVSQDASNLKVRVCLSLKLQPCLLASTGKLLKGGVCTRLPLTSLPTVFQLLLLTFSGKSPERPLVPKGWWSSSILMAGHPSFPPPALAAPSQPPCSLPLLGLLPAPHTLPAPTPWLLQLQPCLYLDGKPASLPLKFRVQPQLPA